MAKEPTPSRYCIKHPTLGRVVGVVWDFLVSMLSLLAIPLLAVAVAVGFLSCSMWFLPVVVALLAVTVFSVLFGVAWSFRGCLNPRD